MQSAACTPQITTSNQCTVLTSSLLPLQLASNVNIITTTSIPGSPSGRIFPGFQEGIGRVEGTLLTCKNGSGEHIGSDTIAVYVLLLDGTFLDFHCHKLKKIVKKLLHLF
jgi:hypothetical protein